MFGATFNLVTRVRVPKFFEHWKMIVFEFIIIIIIIIVIIIIVVFIYLFICIKQLFQSQKHLPK